MDWNAVGAVGQWFAAAATFSAVAVALWQARMARLATLPRIKVRAGHAITETAAGTLDLVYFDAVNVGQRAVTLSALELILPDKRRLVMQEALRELPRRLEEGEKVTIHKPTEQLLHALLQQGYTTKMLLQVCFRDSANNDFSHSWSLDPALWLDLSKKET